MSIVYPTTDLQFFTNTGLDTAYTNSLYFATATDRDHYWDARGKKSIDKCTYQRSNRNMCRVEIPIKQLYNVDYMRYRNNAFEDKWYYAFVVSVNYINNITTEVIYVNDPLMTWMGVFNLRECFVDRQHPATDEIGQNIVEEGLSIGDYITEKQDRVWTVTPENTFARLAETIENGGTGPTYGNIFSGIGSEDFTNQATLSNRINQLVESNKVDNIVSIVMLPTELKDKKSVVTKDTTITKPYTSLNGYVPKNKKLFCYPYKYAVLENSEGSSMEVQYEYAGALPETGATESFVLRLLICGYPTGAEAIMFPVQYKGVFNTQQRLSMTHFPLCGFSTNTYEAYLAQKNAYFEQDMALARQNTMLQTKYGALEGFIGANTQNTGQIGSTQMSTSTQLATAATGGLATDALGMAVGGAMANPVGMTAGAVTSAANALAKEAANTARGALSGYVSGKKNEEALERQNMVLNEVRPSSPSRAYGAAATDIIYSSGLKGYMLYEKCITRKYAVRLDNYFSLYGYAINTRQVPNMNARPHWTYVKTTGCSCNGMLPASDKQVINNIFDNGIRFWHDLNEIGNYSLDNSPA